MSGLALALHEKGFCVTGSDKRESQHVKQLQDSGIDVTLGQAAENIGDAEVIVYTTAISEDDPELVAARITGRPVVHRSELISYLLDQERRIAVAGTHGKTTVTAMIGTIFVELGYDPTVFVGGHWLDIDSNFRLGNGDWAIFEACESDSSFWVYAGCSQVLTSVEPDHLDTYGNFAELRRSFAQFVSLADPQGFIAYYQNRSPTVSARSWTSPRRASLPRRGAPSLLLSSSARPWRQLACEWSGVTMFSMPWRRWRRPAARDWDPGGAGGGLRLGIGR